jgi:hypothetical protein
MKTKSVRYVALVARHELSIKEETTSHVFLRKFVAVVGARPNVVCCLWNMLVQQNLVPEHVYLKHLLWALSLVKLYQTDYFYSIYYGVHPDTFRKWAWLVLFAIEKLKLVS